MYYFQGQEHVMTIEKVLADFSWIKQSRRASQVIPSKLKLRTVIADAKLGVGTCEIVVQLRGSHSRHSELSNTPYRLQGGYLSQPYGLASWCLYSICGVERYGSSGKKTSMISFVLLFVPLCVRS
jgi:hypothetical protein